MFNQNFKLIFSYMCTDGAGHEGPMYWVYGIRHGMMPYIEMAEKFYGLDYKSHPFIQNTHKYAIEMVLPTSYDGRTNKTYRLADHGDVTENDWVGCLAYLANINQDAVAQWYVDKYRKLLDDKAESALNIISYYDTSLKAVSPDDGNKPKMTHFDDLGMVFLKSDHSDNATCMTFRCGPAVGKNAIRPGTQYDLGLGHIHADMNQPQIYTRGENLLGETLYEGLRTESHSTLLVNGKGQWPDRGYINVIPYASNAKPEILKLEDTEKYFYGVGDATEAYPPDEMLTKWRRHFIWMKNDTLLILDDVEVASPKLLILDEPTNGLDPIGIQELRELIRSFPAQGITVILSSHILSEVEQIADHIGIISAGKMGYESKIDRDTDLEEIFMRVVAANSERGKK